MGAAAESEPQGYFVEPDCPVCDRQPEPDEVAHCRECTRPHHLGCWLRHKGCGEPGCGGTHLEVRFRPDQVPPPLLVRRRAEPRMWFFVFVVAYVLSMYATLFLLPPALRDSMVLALGLGFVFGCAGLLLAQSLVTRAYFFDPATGYVSKETLVGPFRWGRRRVWRAFDAIRGLDVQLVRRSLSHGALPEYVLQVWMRDAAGADLLLRDELLRPESPRLRELREVARMLGADLGVTVMGEDEGPDFRVSRITGMPLQAPR